MPTANIALSYGEHHPALSSKWNLRSADAAISAHEQGDFRSSARMAEAMGRNVRISAVLETRIQAVLGLEHSLLPPVEDGAREKQIAEDLRGPWEQLFSEDTAAEALKWRVMLGFWIGELIWYDDRGKLQKNPQRLKIWHPQFSRWDFDRGCVVVSTLDKGEVPVTHGDGKWIFGGGKGPRPWMRGAVRSLWIPWIAQEFGWRDLNLFGERTGQGVLGVKTDGNLDPGERNYLVDQLRMYWRGLIAELPQSGTAGTNTGMELLETGSGEEVFDLILSKSDTAIAIRLLGQNLSTEVKGGSFAAAKSHERVRLDYLEADTDALSSDCQSGVFAPWCERLHGSRDVAPYPHWDAQVPEDNKATAEGQKAFGEAVEAVQKAGFDVANVDELAERHGLRLKKRPVPKVAQPIAAPGTAKPANDTAKDEEVAASRVTLARTQPHPDPGFHQGQEYVDALVSRGTQRAQQALANDIASILTIVRAAQNPQELRAGLVALYSDMNQTEFGAVLERARMMAELAGRYSVIEDVAADT